MGKTAEKLKDLRLCAASNAEFRRLKKEIRHRHKQSETATRHDCIDGVRVELVRGTLNYTYPGHEADT